MLLKDVERLFKEDHEPCEFAELIDATRFSNVVDTTLKVRMVNSGELLDDGMNLLVQDIPKDTLKFLTDFLGI